MIPRLSTIAQLASFPPRPAALCASRRLALGLVVAGVAMIMAASFSTVPVAYCVDCQRQDDSCGPNDATKTSVMDVSYVQVVGDPIRYVEPSSTTSWSITAYWRTAPPPPCREYQETAYADVVWNGTAWQVSNVSLSTNILDIAVCDGYECSGQSGSHSWNYKLLVSIRDPAGNYNLKKVAYATTSVPNGREILFNGGSHVECDSLGSSVSPTSQSFVGYDEPDDEWQSSRCPWSCSVVGGSMTIDYSR